ncbi:MAG: hypothetical protein P8J27_15420 [Mariniblastus sp.]|nr:hypothetical protein [Mariniblastus sp.]
MSNRTEKQNTTEANLKPQDQSARDEDPIKSESTGTPTPANLKSENSGIDRSTQILANIDLLIALHENGERSEASSPIFEAKIDQRFEQLTEQLKQIADKIPCQPDPKLMVIKNDLDHRFHALEQRLEDIADAMKSQQHPSDPQAQPTDELAPRNSDTSSTVNQITNPKSEQGKDPEDSDSHWSRQKAAMLSKYGIDPDHRPSLEATSPVPTAKPELTPPEVDFDNLQEPHNQQTAEDARRIGQLKGELTSKLRDAEVELSIQRAKLSQLNAELDQKKTELDQREAQLAGKYDEYSKANAASSSSLLERLKRHLNAKDRKNLDRL